MYYDTFDSISKGAVCKVKILVCWPPIEISYGICTNSLFKTQSSSFGCGAGDFNLFAAAIVLGQTCRWSSMSFRSPSRHWVHLRNRVRSLPLSFHVLGHRVHTSSLHTGFLNRQAKDVAQIFQLASSDSPNKWCSLGQVMMKILSFIALELKWPMIHRHILQNKLSNSLTLVEVKSDC